MGAAIVGDLGPGEGEIFELRQHFSLRRRRICRRRRHEGGEALVAEWVAVESKRLQRGPPPQGPIQNLSVETPARVSDSVTS